jgi:hypothetical protein
LFFILELLNISEQIKCINRPIPRSVSTGREEKEIAELENNQVTELKDEQERRKIAARSIQPELKEIPVPTWINSLARS